MWAAINNHVTEAVDANIQAIKALKEAANEVDFAPSSGLAKMYLRQLDQRANNFDTELRAFLLAMQPAVQQEKENQE